MRVFQLEKYLTIQHEMTQIIARSSELELALPHLLQVICETTDWDFGEVWHITPAQDRLQCMAIWHVSAYSFPCFVASGQTLTFERGHGLPGRVWESGKPVWMSNVTCDSTFVRASVAQQENLQGGLGIPVRADGRVIGVMTLFSHQSRHLDRNLLNVLDTVGSQIGLFIERKRAEQAEREQARRLAAIEERQRLARDLHDSVTQSLFSANVIAQMLPLLWERRPESIQPNLAELQQLTHDALTEMRALLVELRPPALSGDLGELLRNLTAALTRRTPLNVHLTVEMNADLTADEQIAVYRIVQEALNNIVKHADARHATVHLVVCEDGLCLTIEDDGCGFDPAHTPLNHFGLAVMRERATGIGAALTLDSAVGCGTRLCIKRGG
jgi:signal transduction histidine kinase